ncbi:MAG: hypothetical protein D6786_01270 [Gammaproteobacteria bacterium]|nr:MAG: hypothetical protein D6786_01270 [Gammaproteobacteria bacterium]
MSQKELEELSALIDDEDAGAIDEVVSGCAADEALRQKWYRYHLIGEAMRDELPEAFGIDLADRIRDSIAKEPAILAPAPWRQRWLRPAIGLAVAASVAGLTVIGLKQQGDVETGSPAAQGQIASAVTPPVSPAIRQVATPYAGEPQEPPASAIRATPIPASSRFNSYLVNHLEQRSDFGMIPYVRVVTYDPQQ